VRRAAIPSPRRSVILAIAPQQQAEREGVVGFDVSKLARVVDRLFDEALRDGPAHPGERATLRALPW
jgi:hypothetical protein